jgi:uncharacterized protein with PIN domain
LIAAAALQNLVGRGLGAQVELPAAMEGAWAPPPSRVVLVDTAEVLYECSPLLAAAAAVGVDAEWCSDAAPAAALLQLALWSPSEGLVVLLLDLLALPPAPAAAAVRALFRRPSALKVGFNLAADLRALAARLGAGAAAVMEPLVDAGRLAARLARCGALAGAAPPPDAGLSALVAARLDAPLDKREQVSDWAARPLSPAQCSYAAADASCLLALLDDLIAEARPRANGAAAPAGGYLSELHALEAWPASGVAAPFAWAPAALAAAAQAWGARGDFVGGRLLLSGGGAGAGAGGEPVGGAAGSRRVRAKARRAASPPLRALFPSRVPWLAGGGAAAGAPPAAPARFLVDVMLHGLAHQLRLWGVDAEVAEVAAAGARHMTHRSLAERAAAEGRVILTRDRGFIKRNLSGQAYLVAAETKHAQVAEVAAAFDLRPAGEALLSRCAACSGEFAGTPLAGGELPPGAGVPEGVAARPGEAFLVCARCGKGYWRGGMFARAVERITAAVAALGGGVEAEGEGRRS